MFAAESPWSRAEEPAFASSPAKSQWVARKPVKKKHEIDIPGFWRCKHRHFCPQGPPQSPEYQSNL